MGKFKEKIYRFMYGRYGTDELYNFLSYFNIFLIIAYCLTLLAVPEGLARAIVSLCFSGIILFNFIFEIFRAMSKNISKRRRENERYLKLSRNVKRFFSGNTSRGTKTLNRDDESYIFRDCTKCSSTLRLPRKVGKHKVKCPRCSHSFYVKVKKFNYQKNKK